MSMPAATFSDEDWSALSGADKKALKTLGRTAPLGFETLAKSPGVGQISMDSLIGLGLAVEGPTSYRGRSFALTDKGRLAVEWVHGRRLPVYPS